MLSFDVLEKKQPLTGGMIATVDILLTPDATTGTDDMTITVVDYKPNPDPNATGVSLVALPDPANPAGSSVSVTTDPSTGVQTLVAVDPTQKQTPIIPVNPPPATVIVVIPQPYPISLIPIIGSMPKEVLMAIPATVTPLPPLPPGS